MLLIECPVCGGKVSVDDPNTEKEENWLELVVTCPHCNERFKIQRVAWVRQNLKDQYAYIRDQSSQEQRVRIYEH